MDAYKKIAPTENQFNTIVYRVRGTSSTAFVTRFRCNVGTCSVNANGRVVRVRSINSDVSTGSELRGIVSCEMLVGRVWVRPEIEKSYPSG